MPFSQRTAVNGAEVSRVANLGLLLRPIIDSSQSLISGRRRYLRPCQAVTPS